MLWHCLGANAHHGLRRTNTDKRKAVETLLKDGEWAKWSNNKIAKMCGVSQPFVSSLRPLLITNSSEAQAQRTYTTKHGTTAVMKTENIGKAADKTSDPKKPAKRQIAPEREVGARK